MATLVEIIKIIPHSGYSIPHGESTNASAHQISIVGHYQKHNDVDQKSVNEVKEKHE